MNKRFIILAALLPSILAAEDLTTKSGKRYTGTSVTRVEADGIAINHDDGLAKISFADLPDDLRAKYGPKPNPTPPIPANTPIAAVPSLPLPPQPPISSAAVKDASATIDRYLQALKIVELQEGREMLAKVAWPDWGPLPILLRAETVFETPFETDVPGVHGFKRVINCELKGKDGTPRTEKYLMVAYPDRATQQWKVLCLVPSTDSNAAIAYGLEHLNDTSVGDMRSYNYRFLALWYSVAGKLRLAQATYQKAADLHKLKPDGRSSQEEFNRMVTALNRIVSE